MKAWMQTEHRYKSTKHTTQSFATKAKKPVTQAVKIVELQQKLFNFSQLKGV